LVGRPVGIGAWPVGKKPVGPAMEEVLFLDADGTPLPIGLVSGPTGVALGNDMVTVPFADSVGDTLTPVPIGLVSGPTGVALGNDMVTVPFADGVGDALIPVRIGLVSGPTGVALVPLALFTGKPDVPVGDLKRVLLALFTGTPDEGPGGAPPAQ